MHSLKPKAYTQIVNHVGTREINYIMYLFWINKIHYTIHYNIIYTS